MVTLVEPDLILLQRFRQTGDAAAFAEIVRRYAGAVFATCQRILRDRAAAEDAAQETFYRLMTRPQKVTASLGGWLHRAATRLAMDSRRSETARRRREQAYVRPADELHASWAELVPKLDEAIAALPVDQQELLVRHFLRGQPQSEIAAEARLSAATVSRRIGAAVDALRRELTGRGISIAPTALFGLMARHGTAALPAGLKVTLGKMTLYCTARAGLAAAKPAAAAAGMGWRAVAQMTYTVRWAAAAAGFSFVAVLSGWMALTAAPLEMPSFSSPDASSHRTVNARAERVEVSFVESQRAAARP